MRGCEWACSRYSERHVGVVLLAVSGGATPK